MIYLTILGHVAKGIKKRTEILQDTERSKKLKKLDTFQAKTKFLLGL